MKKIIHLSDLHIGYQDLNTKFGDIVTRIIFHKTPASDYVIVFTGDLVDDATRQGSYEEVSVYINRLKQAGFTVLIIPGNHDYGTGTLGNEKYVAIFKQHFFGPQEVSYPKLDIIDDTAFIGLDSMADELHWYDKRFAEGELGDVQLKALKDMLENKIKGNKYTVVYLHHHPFHPKPFHHLIDSEKLGNILKGFEIDALLFGHNHDGKIWNGGWGISRVYDGGSSTSKDGKPNPHRVIDLSKDPSSDYDAQF